MNNLERLDQQLLVWLNGFHSPVFDQLMFYASQTWFWIPFYAVLIFFCIKYYKKQSIWIFLIIIVGITASDQLCNVIKYSVARYRPSHNIELKSLLHLYQFPDGTYYRGGLYGFCSAHAANSFCLATVIIYFFRKHSKIWLVIMPLYAILVSCTRIYLGVHYPADILCGGLLGIGVAGLIKLQGLVFKCLTV